MTSLINRKFVFYDLGTGAPEGFAETLAVAYACEDCGFQSKADGFAANEIINALARRLVAFANEFGLTGNVWQQWLTYILMMHENPFTLACERCEIRSDASMMILAQADLAEFMRLFGMDFADCAALLSHFIDYKAPHAELTEAGKRISELAARLADAADRAKRSDKESADTSEFCSIITEYYAEYGTGIYGLYKAFRVQPAPGNASGGSGIGIIPVTDSTDVTFDDLIGCEDQKHRLRANTEAFIKGLHANNVLLYGDSGTGKSTSIHALTHDYADSGLRLIEISKQDRRYLPQVLAEAKKRRYRFVIFLDDLSFEENESDYKELKAMLEGALETRTDRVLIYATSNRRHLIRETWRDRGDMEYQEDIHHSDTMEEKLSLAGRFGVTIYYSKPDAGEYLRIVREIAAKEGIKINETRLADEARKWELRHGGMSGRTARQFITWLQSGAIASDVD